MSAPRLLDLFCCAGGAGMGYHRAGFDVVGVDIAPQPHYPFPFFQGDALEVLRILLVGGSIMFSDGETLGLSDLAAIHASPPCHDHSALVTTSGRDGTGDLLPTTREALQRIGKPFVLENVEGAEMGMNTMTLCGTQFGLFTDTKERGIVWLKRHRQFEANFRLIPPTGHRSCTSGKAVIGVYGTGNGYDRGTSASRGGWQGTFADRRAVMGIDWMDRRELSQSIPPAYTEFIGGQLLESLERAA